jgi:hypothetical protein
MAEDGVEALNPEQPEKVASSFKKEVKSAGNYKTPWAKVQRPATG